MKAQQDAAAVRPDSIPVTDTLPYDPPQGFTSEQAVWENHRPTPAPRAPSEPAPSPRPRLTVPAKSLGSCRARAIG